MIHKILPTLFHDEPETDLEGCKNLAEKIREKVDGYKFDIVNRVTVSAGVAMFHEEDSESNFVNRADDAMYKAKANGRNRVEVSVCG